MVIEKNRSWGMVIDTDKCNGCEWLCYSLSGRK